MSYLGKVDMNDANIQRYTLTSSTASTVLFSALGWTPANIQSLRVTINGVVQQNISLTSTALDLGGALVATDELEVIGIESMGNIITPADNSVTEAKLTSSVSGRLGVEWQAVQTTGFTAVAGKAYPCNTTAAAFTVTLPSSASAGDQVEVVDYAGTFDTKKLTIDPNGLKLNGSTDNLLANKERVSILLTYVDVTQGWVVTSAANDGTSAVSPTTYSVDFLVIAGGGAGGHDQGGGGGAGGYRASYNSETSGGGGSSEASLTFDAGVVYTISVGAGGAGVSTGTSNPGVDSYISGTGISTITSTGGGRGGLYNTTGEDMDGGSGGGRGAGPTHNGAGGSGTSNQGYDGGSSITNYAGGGGGAGAAGSNASGSDAGDGGNGVVSTITGGSVTRTGGGGGGLNGGAGGNVGAGGSGGGGVGSKTPGDAGSGTVNTGSAGGGNWGGGSSGNGGKGVIILRMPTISYSGVSTGSPSVGTSGTDTILTFNDTGSYTG